LRETTGVGKVEAVMQPSSEDPHHRRRRLDVGASIASFELTAASGEALTIPDRELTTHLQLRRFAGCPICNLHLRSVVERHDEIAAAGVREVVVFHSTAAELDRFAPEVPFALVADPGRGLYREFGVEASPRSLLHPGVRGVVAGGPARALGSLRRGEGGTPLRPHGGRLGLPGDFLIDPDGRLLAVKYGEHAYDQWSVDELLAAACPVADARAR
jgi:peroxiredoxin